MNTLERSVRRRSHHAVAAALLVGTFLGGFGVPLGAALAGSAESGAGSGAIQPSPPANKLADFSGLVTQVKPAVVSITTRLRPHPAAQEIGPGLPFPFPFGGMPQARAQGVEARGSGFLIDADGTIVTNNHVVKGAETVSVTLDDGTELPAKVVGTDPRTDLAVLRVAAGHALPFIRLGESDDVRPGQWVVAVGNPFGLGGSVTAGIVSARGRDIGEGPYDSFIQVDAPINQGNSGGPLFTQDGKVVGVNTAILSPSGGSVGIGFAIPSDTVRTVVAQLQRDGHVTRGYLGVEAQPVTAAIRSALNLPETRGEAGALVASVENDSPAQRAGLRPGDLITTVNGQAVADPRGLATGVAAVPPGQAATVTVLRDGASRDVAVTMADLPAATAEAAGESVPAGGGGIGLALEPLSPALRDGLNLPSRQGGAVVAQVQPNSPAAQAGLRSGDLVVGVGSKPVANPSEAVEAIRAGRRDGHAVALRILRDGHSAYVAVGGATG